MLQEDIDRAREDESDGPAACRCPLSYAIARAIGYHTHWTVASHWAMSEGIGSYLIFDEPTIEHVRLWDFTGEMEPFTARAEAFREHYEFKRAAPPLFDKQQIAAFLSEPHVLKGKRSR